MSDSSSTLAKTESPKIISISEARKLRLKLAREDEHAEEYAYQAKILGMDKLELLEEMLRFNQEKTEQGELSIQKINRGKYLFKALEERAETEELRLLARSYRRHLQSELTARISKS